MSELKYKTVCVIGLGYIGLPTASLLATRGFNVTGVDINPAVLSGLAGGCPDINEPDLDVMVRSAVLSGNLTLADTPSPAEIYIIAVPTPLTANKAPDLSQVEAAARSLAPHLHPDALVVLESTCPVGATEMVARQLSECRPDLRTQGAGDNRIYIAHSPERVLPGQILRELVDNDRLVGGLDEEATKRCAVFYRSFVQGQVIETDARSAELAKLAENAYRDLNIAFANELSNVCRALHMDVWEVIALANCHPRVDILNPGPGVGGHCIAIDPWFIASAAPEITPLIQTARRINDLMPATVVDQVRHLCTQIHDPVIACLGLAYKADVDDLRESPAVQVVADLARDSVAPLYIVEPFIGGLPPQLEGWPGIHLSPLADAVDRANIIVVLADHTVFKSLTLEQMAGKAVIDTRGLFRGAVK